MKGLYFLLFLSVQAKYILEYTELVAKSGVLLAIYCAPGSPPDCGTAYERKTSFRMFENVTLALDAINRKLEETFVFDPWRDRIKGFEFVNLYKLEPIKVEERVVGEETYVETVQVEKKRETKEWVVAQEIKE